MVRWWRKAAGGEAGFTLIEVLVVVCIISILVTLGIPAFFAQRYKADDANARSLLRSAMITLECGYTETGTFDPTNEGMAPAALQRIEPSITFEILAHAATADDPADATDNTVSYAGDQTSYEVGCRSASGLTFGIRVEKDEDGGRLYYVDGEVVD